MGQRGPKPKSPALKILAGNPGKRPISAPSGAPRHARRGRPLKPRELTGEAAAEWDRIIPELEVAGWLAVVDRAGLAAYCLAWAQMVWADGVLLAEGAIVREPIQTARGESIGFRLKAHPAARIHADASRRVRMFLSEFGLTPASRARLEGDGGPAPAGAGNRVAAIRERIEQARAAGPG